MNKNENTTYPKLWNAARAVLKGNLQLQKPTMKKKTLSSMAQLYLTLLKEREKEVQTKPKTSRRKKIIKNRAEINGMDNRIKQNQQNQNSVVGHKNKLKMDKRSKCKTRNYKTPRGEHRENTLRHKSQQDPL